MLAPLVEETLRKITVDPEGQDIDALLLGAIDKSASKDFNDESNGMWPLFLSSFDVARSPG